MSRNGVSVGRARWKVASLRGRGLWGAHRVCGPPPSLPCLCAGAARAAAGPAMTRWARRNGPPGEKALEATPWEEMVNGSQGREGRAGPLSLKKEQEKRKKKNKKKKDYLNEDVNGFAAYLKQSSRGGEVAEAESTGLEKEVAMALKRDKRREDRRLKRQEKKKNAMVSFALSRGCLPVRGSLLKT